ncbi:MAG: hypothetical protein ACP5G2_08080 [Candidatus Bipolaricaulaceae bacterium]
MRRLAILLASLLLAGTLGIAQGLPNPFDVGLGVRAAGLGGAYTAIAAGSEALLYNPAGLAHLAGLRADSTYTGAMGLYSTTWLAGAMPGLGGGVAYLSAGGITDPQGDPLAFSHLAVVVGGGADSTQLPLVGGVHILPFPLSLGASLKFDHVQAAEAVGSGLAFDLGALTQLDTAWGTFRVGFVIRDLGVGAGLGEGWTSEFALGAALLTATGLIASADLGSEYAGLGVGWGFPGGIEVRGGIQSQGGATRFCLGLGVSWQAFVIDYALTTHSVLGSSHRFGFGMELGG